MTRQVIFRDYQEQQATDHNKIQEYVNEVINYISKDAITATPRFSGFETTKTGPLQITVAPGRMYDVDGKIYARRSNLVQALATFLPMTAFRCVRMTCYGAVNETDVQDRDFIVDVVSRAVDPESVAMTRSYDAVISFISGTESAFPTPPATPANHVAIADIYLSTSEITHIVMLNQNSISSLERIKFRTDVLDEFKKVVESRILAIASQIASIETRLFVKGESDDLSQLYYDMARVKERLELPDNAVDYGADRFLTKSKSDADNSLQLGYDAWVNEGVRFPDENATVFSLALFSNNDPNASVSDGLLLPAHDSIVKIAIDGYDSSLGIAQYGFQDFAVVQKTMSRTIIRYGDVFTVCTNSRWWRTAENFNPQLRTFQRAGETFIIPEGAPLPPQFGGTRVKIVRVQRYWEDTVETPYWDLVKTTHNISGAQVAQTFLVANDMWVTKLGFWLAEKAADENIFVTLCEVENGVPNLKKAIAHTTVNHETLAPASWIRFPIHPTLLNGGSHYAIVLTSNANHKIGMVRGQNYIDGTFFYNTDGVYYQGDLTKDMMLEVWGARFKASQVVIETTAWSLNGGIKNVEINADAIIPASTSLVFEVQPQGSGEWVPLDPKTNAFAQTPPLARARLRFVGSRDVMPAVRLNNSEVRLSRPKTQFRHVSKVQTLASASNSIYVKVIVENFDDTPHDISCKLNKGDLSAELSPSSITSKTISEIEKRFEYTFRFQPSSAIDDFAIVLSGSTNSASNTFHVAERVHYSM